jgi:hypothetical protein
MKEQTDHEVVYYYDLHPTEEDLMGENRTTQLTDEGNTVIITKEEARYAPEHWKDAHLPCSHHHSSGTFSR